MKAAPFEYVRATSVEETVTVIAQADGDGKILAGGQSLVPLLALRLARPAVLVDINRIPGLDTIDVVDGAVEVGALVRHRALVEQDAHPLLSAGARWIGHTAIRSRGTVAGSIAHADAAAELPALALATAATVTVVGTDGERVVAADDLFLGALTTSLGEDEMITRVRFPHASRWGFAEFSRRHGDFALVAAVVAEVDGAVRVVVGGVASVPFRVRRAEEVLADGGTAAEAGAAAAAEVTPIGDLHGSADYRRAMAAEMVRRAALQTGIR